MGATVDLSGAVHVIGGYSVSGEVVEHDVLLGDGGWTTAAPLPVPTRAAAVTAGSDGVLYYVGGYDGVEEVGNAYAFELDGGWAQLPSPTYAPGWETSADLGADGKIYVFGGEGDEITDSGVNLNSVNSKTQIYDPASSTWTTGAPMPARRMQHRVLRGSDGLFYVIGGEDENQVVQPTVFVYHPTTDTWTDGPPIVVPDIDGGTAGSLDAGDGGVVILVNSFGAAATGDRTYFVVAGGTTTDGNDSPPYFNGVYVFDVAAQTWSRYATPLPFGRRELAAAISSCTLRVVGGSDGSRLDSNDSNVLSIGPDTDTDGVPDACDPDDDNDGTPDALDCAPLDPTVHPGATETCNGKDDNCNGQTDEGCAADGGTRDGGATRDGGSLLTDASSGGGSGDGSATQNNDNGDSGSSGCGCSLVPTGESGGVAMLCGLGLFAALARRSRRKTRSRSKF